MSKPVGWRQSETGLCSGEERHFGKARWGPFLLLLCSRRHLLWGDSGDDQSRQWEFCGWGGAFQECVPVGQYCDTLDSGGGADFTGDHIFNSVFGYTHTPDGTSVPDRAPRSRQWRDLPCESWSIDNLAFQVEAMDLNHDGKNDFAAVEDKKLVVCLNQGTTCSAPSKAGVHVCAPVATTTYYSDGTATLSLLAAGKGASGSVNHMEVWVDEAHVANYAGSKINATMYVAVGNHQAAITEVDSKKKSIKSTPITVTIGQQWWSQ